MSNLEEAYQSLDSAKREEQTLRDKKEKYASATVILRHCCEDFMRYRTLSGALEECEEEKKRDYFNIFIALLVYVLVFGLMDVIAVFCFGNVDMITTSIGAGIGSYSVCISKFVKSIRKNNKRIADMQEIQEILANDPKYQNKSLQDILELISEDREIIQDELYAKSGAIREYEEALKEANQALAEEVLKESGIEASVTLNSSMKVLAKRYEPNRK